MGWFFPPPFLVSRVIDQLLESSAQGTLVIPSGHCRGGGHDWRHDSLSRHGSWLTGGTWSFILVCLRDVGKLTIVLPMGP